MKIAHVLLSASELKITNLQPEQIIWKCTAVAHFPLMQRKDYGPRVQLHNALSSQIQEEGLLC